MPITRRTAAQALCALSATPSICAYAPGGWTREWDDVLIRAAVGRSDESFDPAENMLRSRAGGEYRYHTNLRSMTVHPTRDSLRYGLFMLEAGQTAKALRVIDRVVSLQDTDAQSKWYGLWSYYLEEPLPKMAPADWNWADFNGSCLLLMELRHGGKLEPALRARVREAIRHAAASVRRRNVSMTYTNIAVQGTFVTLAAAELLRDADLLAYARERLRRFASTVDQTGSFAEYNSPTYANVTIENLTRMLMHVRDEDSAPLVKKLHERAWLHLASHWHAPSRQLAGPMSRAYSTDIGRPLWLQKALDNRVVWAELAELRQSARGGDGEVGMLNYRVPDALVPMFVELKQAREHREVFLPGGAGVRPVQGTTWLAPEFTLGSVNRGDFWVQRRPLLAYWGKPAKWAQLRVLKDDYDFSSALLYSVQREGYVLGVVNFRTPGGDKHISLDPLPDEFAARRLRLRLDLPDGLERFERAGAPSRVAFDAGSVKLFFEVRQASFGAYKGLFSVDAGGVSFDLLPPKSERVRWAGTGEAFVLFTLAMEATREPLATFEARVAAMPFDGKAVEWKTRAGSLRVEAGRRVTAVGDQDRAFGEFIDGSPAPLRRLSEELLA